MNEYMNFVFNDLALFSGEKIDKILAIEPISKILPIKSNSEDVW